MNNYELTIVLDGKVTAAKKKSFIDKVEKLVKTAKGKVSKPQDWGTKNLAYTIKKSDTGAFLIFPLELPAEAAKSMNDKIRLEDEVIRYLLIRQD